MLRTTSRERGVTLVEMMVAMVILVIALGIGVPSLVTWMQNSEVKATAQSVLTGLQLARAEAVRQNARVQFQLTGGAAGTPSWTVTASDSTGAVFPSANLVQSSSAGEGGDNTSLGVNSTAAASQNYASALSGATNMATNPPPGVVFDGFGRVASSNVTTVTTITRVDISGSASGVRRLVIVISPNGLTRMCDPAAATGNSQAC